MFIIPGILIAILTFPGVIIHELAHRLFCRLARVPVYEVCYFQFKNPCGYVIHEAVDGPWRNLLICVGPFLLNTIIGMVILSPAAVEVIEFHNYTDPLALFLCWLGVSILMHAFPSSGDAKALYTSVIKNRNVNLFAKALVLPVIGLIYAGAVGSIVWLDLLYAVGVGLLLPNLLIRLI